MKKLAIYCALFAISGSAADWLMSRADPEGTGWQQHGKSIHPGNVHQLKLLWKRTLDNRSRGLNSLATPTILGPIITHRGIKELVFVGGSSDNIYAVDADLGRVFWKRHIGAESTPDDTAKWPCQGGLTAAPAFAPPPPEAKVREESDEGASPMRPFFFVASDGILHTVRPSDGIDMAPTRKFVPANANLSDLRYAKGQIYASTSNGCGGAQDGTWAINTTDPSAKPTFAATHAIDAAPRATWVDASGTRWIYVSMEQEVRAFRADQAGRARKEPDWVAPGIPAPLPPIIANGVVYVLASGEATTIAKSTHATLYALDAHTGKQLYSSGDAVTSFVHSSGLAIANGHVCFGTWDNTLYCFGFPIEIE